MLLLWLRDQQADRQAKQVMLNEFCLTTGYHRKYAIWHSEWPGTRETTGSDDLGRVHLGRRGKWEYFRAIYGRYFDSGYILNGATLSLSVTF